MALKLQRTFLQPGFRGMVLKELIQLTQNVGKSTPIKIEQLKLGKQQSYVDLSPSMATLNINSIRIPPCVEPSKAKIPPPMPLSKIVELPQIQKNITYEDQLPVVAIEEPKPSILQEKQAARLIVIRRKKMKKHKLKKLRKKMRFVWAKVRQKRELKKEKEFQAFLLDHIKRAQMFDPAKYAAEKIAKAKEVELPKFWYGMRYPENIIKQLIEEKKMKENEKQSDERRRASMSPYVKDYLDKLPK